MLDKIIKHKLLELKSTRCQVPQKDLEKRAKDTEPACDFLQNFNENDINIIAEFKRASPSVGDIRKDAIASEIAKIYEENGAKAVSVLTDSHFFKGSLQDLKNVKEGIQLPVLRKDFILAEYNIYEARAFGADAVLIIVSAIDDYQLKDYTDLAYELGMTALVEVHSQEELKKILSHDLRLIGINNRNLKTFKTDIETTLQALPLIPEGKRVISESGLDSHDKILKLKENGVDGFLIGETLMKAENIANKLKELQGS